MPTNDSPGSNLNVMSLTFRTAYGQQTHTMVRVIGNAVFRATALGLTRFQVSLTGCPAINNIDLFTGFANHISGQTAGSCDVFALEVEGLGSVGK